MPNDFQPILPKPFKDDSPSSVQKIDVAPFNTNRLLPTRHRTKNAILSILLSGEVVIEFIKYKIKYDEYRVVDVCRITKDGLRIVIYQPDAGRYAEKKSISKYPMTLNSTHSFLLSVG